MSIEIGMKCAIFNCTELARVKGMCMKHYKRVQRHSDPDFNARPKIVEGEKNSDHPLYSKWRRITRQDLGKSICEEWRSFSNFVRDVGVRIDGHQLRRRDINSPWCLSNVYWASPTTSVSQRMELKERIRLKKLEDPYYSKAVNLRKHYGITLDQFNQMLADQGGVCKICGNPEPRAGNNLSVDHCHDTKIVRSLLCSNCNTVLGHAKDSISTLERCIEYLKYHQTPQGQ